MVSSNNRNWMKNLDGFSRRFCEKFSLFFSYDESVSAKMRNETYLCFQKTFKSREVNYILEINAFLNTNLDVKFKSNGWVKLDFTSGMPVALNLSQHSSILQMN